MSTNKQESNQEQGIDIYTDEFLMKMPSKRVVNQAPEIHLEPPPQSIPQSNLSSSQKKGLGGLSGLMKGEVSANSYLMTKYNIFLNLNSHGQKLIEELILELPNDCIVSECIAQSLKLFVERFQGNKIQSFPPNFDISQNPDDYLLYFANKKGERKLDLPGLEFSQVLSKTHFFRFAIVEKKICKQPKIEEQQSEKLTQQAQIETKDGNQKTPSQIEKQNNQYQQAEQLPNKNKKNNNVDSNEMYEETCCLCFTVKRQKKK